MRTPAPRSPSDLAPPRKVSIRNLAFLVAQTPRIAPALSLPKGAIFRALPEDSTLIGYAISHTALLGKGLAGVRRLLNSESPLDPTLAGDKPHPWAGFTVIPFVSDIPIAHDQMSPFGRAIDQAHLDEISAAIGQPCLRGWVVDLEGLVSVCYYGTQEPRRIGALLNAYLEGKHHVTAMDSGCLIESRPGADKPICVHFHTADSWIRSPDNSHLPAAARRMNYAKWRFEAMKLVLVLHSLYQIPYEVVRATSGKQNRLMELRTIGDPWLIDRRPCAITVDRASKVRVVAHRFGSDITLFHYVYLVDASGSEHFYAGYYCLLQDSEAALLKHIAAFAEQNNAILETYAEDNDDPFE